MAKLENVRHESEEMIEFDGVRYAKSEDDAEVGDIIYNKTGVPGQEANEFYKVVEIDAFVRVEDEYGNPNGWMRGSNGFHYEVYKSTEEKNEVQSDEMYEIDVTEMKEGDYVRVDREDVYSLTEGEYYEVIEKDAFGDPLIMDDDGDELDGGGIDEFTVFRKGKAPESKVTSIESRRKAEVTTPIRGQVVKLISGGSDFPLLGFENGQEYVVVRPSVHGMDGERVEIEGSDGRRGFAKLASLELKDQFQDPINGDDGEPEDDAKEELDELLEMIMKMMMDGDEMEAPTEAPTSDLKVGDNAVLVDNPNEPEGVPFTRFEGGKRVTIVDHSPFASGNFVVEDETGDAQILSPKQLKKVS